LFCFLGAWFSSSAVRRTPFNPGSPMAQLDVEAKRKTDLTIDGHGTPRSGANFSVFSQSMEEDEFLYSAEWRIAY
jgi:hypothetical protein